MSNLTKSTMMSAISLLLLGLILSGCVVEPSSTPALVDPTGFVTYVHPTGVFTLSMPPTWVIDDVSDDYALDVSFSPPGAADPVISLYVVTTNAYSGLVQPQEENATPSPESYLEAAITSYQSTFYDQETSSAIYKEIDRETQLDGSLRIQFLLEAPQGTTQHNDFVQIVEPYFIAMRIRLPDDQTQLRTLSRVVDTFTLNREAGWQSSDAAISASSNRDAVGFSNLNAWVDRNGGFVIVGQIVNNAENALEFVRITAQLYDEGGALLDEQDDFVSSDIVLPGEFTPFSIAFNDGLPPGTVRYDLSASARYTNFDNRNFYGSENFAVSSEANFNDNGLLDISGQVRNEGLQAANLVKVIVTIFDAQQRVIATDTTLVDMQKLSPGETSDFSVIFVELGGVPHTFLVTAQGVLDE